MRRMAIHGAALDPGVTKYSSRLEEEIVFVVIVMSMPFEITEVVGPFLTEEAAANYTTSLTNCGCNWAVCQLSDP
jgi:hypothetical protein